MRMIILDLKGPSLGDEGAVSMLTGLLTVQLSAYPAFEVSSGAEVRQMLALEGEKQKLGCEEDMSCLAEIAGAMGARLVVFGEIGKLGSRYLLNLTLYDSQAGRTAGRAAMQASSLDEVVEGMPAAVDKLVGDFLRAQGIVTDGPAGPAVAHAPTTPAPAAAPAPASSSTSPAAAAEPGSYGWLRWSGGIVGFLAGALFVGIQALSLSMTLVDAGVPPDVFRLMITPITGHFALALWLAESVGESPGGDGPPEWAVPAVFALVGGEALVGLLSFAGFGLWSSAGALEADAGLLGQTWVWGFTALALGMLAGGLALDGLSDSARNQELDVLDFVPIPLYLGAVVAAGTGWLVQPFGGGVE